MSTRGRQSHRERTRRNGSLRALRCDLGRRDRSARDLCALWRRRDCATNRQPGRNPSRTGRVPAHGRTESGRDVQCVCGSPRRRCRPTNPRRRRARRVRTDSIDRQLREPDRPGLVRLSQGRKPPQGMTGSCSPGQVQRPGECRREPAGVAVIFSVMRFARRFASALAVTLLVAGCSGGGKQSAPTTVSRPTTTIRGAYALRKWRSWPLPGSAPLRGRDSYALPFSKKYGTHW